MNTETRGATPQQRDLRFVSGVPGGSETSWYTRICAVLLIGFVFSPVDSISDFIPVVGMPAEMVAVPLGVIAARTMISGKVFDKCRERSREIMKEGKRPPVNRAVAVVVVAVCLLMAAMGALLALRAARGIGVGT